MNSIDENNKKIKKISIYSLKSKSIFARRVFDRRKMIKRKMKTQKTIIENIKDLFFVIQKLKNSN
jgi:C4-dicarboxylate transporter